MSSPCEDIQRQITGGMDSLRGVQLLFTDPMSTVTSLIGEFAGFDINNTLGAMTNIDSLLDLSIDDLINNATSQIDLGLSLDGVIPNKCLNAMNIGLTQNLKKAGPEVSSGMLYIPDPGDPYEYEAFDDFYGYTTDIESLYGDYDIQTSITSLDELINCYIENAGSVGGVGGIGDCLALLDFDIDGVINELADITTNIGISDEGFFDVEGVMDSVGGVPLDIATEVITMKETMQTKVSNAEETIIDLIEPEIPIPPVSDWVDPGINPVIDGILVDTPYGLPFDLA